MKITILSLFPEAFQSYFHTSIIKRALDENLVTLEIINFRDYSKEPLSRVDFPPIGGGAGMIISALPLIDCLKEIKKENSKVFLLSASGTPFKQNIAHKMASYDHLILICGHYEGIDDRIKYYIDGEISIGDYILTGGELGAMVVADSIIRLLPNVIKQESIADESFEGLNLLEYPQYTQPRIIDGHEVPKILYSGNHKAIADYRFKERVRKTIKVRKELLDTSKFTKHELKLYSNLDDDSEFDSVIEKSKKFTN